MENLSEADARKVNGGICPDCGDTQFFLGPRAGECENVECVGCGANFNTTPIPQIAQRIGHNLSGMFTKGTP
jgi:Zn ribbon nucleic-acid-binding protein